MKADRALGPAGKFARAWIGSKLTPLVIVGSLLICALAVWKLPREEEPQIVVPMVDIFVQVPGASALEVEARVTRPMEKLLWEIPGVEYIYSTSSPVISTANRYLRMIAGAFVQLTLALGHWVARTGICLPPLPDTTCFNRRSPTGVR